MLSMLQHRLTSNHDFQCRDLEEWQKKQQTSYRLSPCTSTTAFYRGKSFLVIVTGLVVGILSLPTTCGCYLLRKNYIHLLTTKQQNSQQTELVTQLLMTYLSKYGVSNCSFFISNYSVVQQKLCRYNKNFVECFIYQLNTYVLVRKHYQHAATVS